MFFQRRLQPLWLLALGLVMVWSVGLAYGAVLSAAVGQAIGICGSFVVAFWWYSRKADLKVTAQGVYVGKRFVEYEYIGQAAAFDAQDFALAVRKRSTAFLSLRGRLDGGLFIEIVDVRDPHACWLISLEQPELAVAAIHKARSATA